ncbi:MAG: PQQ-binding-like beta-propeller repeat protein [Anaerolineales bacterium]
MRKKLVFVTLILLVAVLLSGCAGPVRGTTWAGLAASETTAYLADGAMVYAINLSDGTEAWHYPAKADTKKLFYATPAITTDGLVIVGSAGTNHLLAAINPKDIDPDTGSPKEAWTFTGAKDHWVAAPLIIGDKLFAANGDGNIYVLNLTDGQSIKVAEKTIEVGGRLWAQPTTDGTRIFVTSLDHSVAAIDAATYEILWHQDLTSAILGSPVIGADGMLYVGTLNSHFEKIDPATGNHETVLTTDGRLWGSPAVKDDSIYVADLNGYLYAYDTTSGSNTWSSIKPDGAITAGPLVLPDAILFATEAGATDKDPGNLYAVNTDGTTKWNKKLGGQKSGKIYTTPVLAGNLILVAPLGADGYLYAYNASDGSEVTWSPFTPGK